MKQVTLNFREVAVDGLPKKSCVVAVLPETSALISTITDVRFSAKHKAFNCGDETDASTATERRKLWSNVKYWIPMDELDASIKGGETT